MEERGVPTPSLGAPLLEHPRLRQPGSSPNPGLVGVFMAAS